MGYSFDAEYVRRLSEGDELIARHFEAYFRVPLYLKARRRLRNPEEFEDARQETLTRVLAAVRTKGGVRDPRRLGGFVHATCENVIREMMRKRKRMPPAVQPLSQEVDPGEGVDTELVRSEVAEHVRQVLDELPESDGTLLREVFLEEQDRDEVCKRRKVTREYLRVLLHRARERFRERYQESLARRARAQRAESSAGGTRAGFGD